jgi:tRNA dimethylallyltransferase
MPLLNDNINKEVAYYLNDLTNCYNMLEKLDPIYMAKIKKTDKYRIAKALQIYISTKDIPTNFFLNNKAKPIIDDINIYQIDTPVDILRHRISKRTNIMINSGIINEVIKLEKQYTREPNCMSAIGIVETLDYLDGKINKAELEELISIHTAQLAKRQRTFNRSQFTNITKASVEKLEDIILGLYS